MAERARRERGGGGGEEGEEYERRRQARIRENQARLVALGLPELSSSLLVCGRKGGASVKKGKEGEGSGGDGDDDEYRPSDEESASPSEEEKEDDVKKGSGSNSPRASKKKVNNKNVPVQGRRRKKLFAEVDAMELDEKTDDDVAVQKAIALSLGEQMEGSEAELKQCSPYSGQRASKNSSRKEDCSETAGRGKKKKGNVRRVQMTEDEAIAYFFSFDESGKGKITLHDLQRVVISHDFNWTDKEMAEMIHSFDGDADGMLTFGDFRNILSRCNVLQDSRNS